MSGLSLPRVIDRLHLAYGVDNPDRTTYVVERLRKTEAAMYREVCEAEGATVSDVATSTRPMLAERVIEVVGVGGDCYPADIEGRRLWWEEMRTDYEVFGLGRLMLSARVGNLDALSFDAPSSPSRSQRTPEAPTEASDVTSAPTTPASPDDADSSSTTQS